MAQQILDETATSSLPISKFRNDGASGSSGKMRSFGAHAEELKGANVPEPKTMIHPSRSSSLSNRRTSTFDPPYAQNVPTGQVVFDHGRFEDRPPPISQAGAVTQPKSGVEDLAGNRAKLYVVQRRVLEHIGRECGWVVGWAAFDAVKATLKNGFRDIELDESDERKIDHAKEELIDETSSPTIGLCELTLLEALASLGDFRNSYEVCVPPGAIAA